MTLFNMQDYVMSNVGSRKLQEHSELEGASIAQSV
jgi:hypothetical protein